MRRSSYEPETSVALGFGFRCGFLGLLHMEIVQERLERNFNLDLIATSPSVVFRVTRTDGTVEMIDNPSKLPVSNVDRHDRRAVRQGDDHHAARLRRRDHGDRRIARRGTLLNMEYLHDGRVILTFEMPLIEVIVDYLRPAQIADQGLRLARLRGDRLSRRRSGQARDPAQRRTGRRALVYRRAREGAPRAAARWPRSSKS